MAERQMQKRWEKKSKMRRVLSEVMPERQPSRFLDGDEDSQSMLTLLKVWPLLRTGVTQHSPRAALMTSRLCK